MFASPEADQMFIAVALRTPNLHLFVERCKEVRRTKGALSKEDIQAIENELSPRKEGIFY